MGSQPFMKASRFLEKIKVTWLLSTIGMILFTTGGSISIWLFYISFIFFGLAALCVIKIDKYKKIRLDKQNREWLMRL
ncbi:hypothetical protein [Prochlorococcus sp. MIT 0603]|uniref:hypothetical protein n=1 Tax=Prochlorococcus sp. MIT 0603 TaxID=1499500 RepID=UPI0012680F5C|nr:hypothetical protein [Prochlorococcus sp. MIT 0603]